jgi:hypothetical protein
VEEEFDIEQGWGDAARQVRAILYDKHHNTGNRDRLLSS